MKIFQCQNCGHTLLFESTHCESCGSSLGYIAQLGSLSALKPLDQGWQALARPGVKYRYCDNHVHQVCNWLVADDSDERYCEACRLNRKIPDLDLPQNLQAWHNLEQAKHRLVYSLLALGLPIQSKAPGVETGLAFDFLSDELTYKERDHARTGHKLGVITINIAEADSAQRERRRTEMAEPYRTLIGHFRHEVGHYYWSILISPDMDKLAAFRQQFGDESLDYKKTLQRHYEQGPPSNWQQNFISAYAASHPWEDWAETWAHYLHLIDTLETAFTFGLSLKPQLSNMQSLNMQANFDPYLPCNFDDIINQCLPLTFAVNSLNRGMGQPDLYPFVFSSRILDKLRFVHNLIRESVVR